MLNLFKEDMSELIEAVAFCYDIVSDTLYLFGEKRTCISSRNKIEHFFEDMKKGKLLDEKARRQITDFYENLSVEQTTFKSKLQIKNAKNQYEYYDIKGKLRREEQVVHGILMDMNQELTVLEELEKKAFIDPLTKIYNRNGLKEKLKHEMKSVDTCCKGAMFLIDLDNFKMVNDSMGHLLGDALLVEIAEAIQSVFFENAVISRIGGDEFLVFAHHEEDTSIYEQKAKQLCEKVKELYNKREAGCQMTLSIGIAIAEKKEAFNELFNRADIALYKVKTSGKNGYFFYEDGMQFLPYNSIETGKNEPITKIIESNGFTQLKLLIDHSIDLVNEEENAEGVVEQILFLLLETFCANTAYLYCYNKELSETGIVIYGTGEEKMLTSTEIEPVWEQYQEYFNLDGIFYCNNVEYLEEAIKKKVENQKIETMLQVLIQRKGKIIGLLGLNHCKEKKFWLQGEIDVIHTIGKVISAVVYRLLAKEKKCLIKENEGARMAGLNQLIR